MEEHAYARAGGEFMFLPFLAMFASVYLVGYFVVFRGWGPGRRRPEAASCLTSLFHGTPAALLTVRAVLSRRGRHSGEAPARSSWPRATRRPRSWCWTSARHTLPWTWRTTSCSCPGRRSSSRTTSPRSTSSPPAATPRAPACTRCWRSRRSRRPQAPRRTRGRSPACDAATRPRPTARTAGCRCRSTRRTRSPGPCSRWCGSRGCLDSTSPPTGTLPAWAWMSWTVVIGAGIALSELCVGNLWVTYFRERKESAMLEKKKKK